MLSHLQRCNSQDGALMCKIELRKRDDLVDGQFDAAGEILATREIVIGDVLITKLRRGDISAPN